MRQWERTLEQRYCGQRGWKLERGGTHLKLVREDTHRFVTAPSTNSDWRTILNTDREVRKVEKELVDQGVLTQTVGRISLGRPPLEDFNITMSDDGRRVSTIKCNFCEATDTKLEKKGAKGLTMSALAHYFRSRGWHVKRDRIEDKCPACLKAEAPPVVEANGHAIPEPAIEQIVVKLNPEPVMDPPEVGPEFWAKAKLIEPAPKMQLNLQGLANVHALRRADAQLERRIFRALDKYYVDYDTGYISGESDASIAALLKVDVEKVALVRRDHFGPETSESPEAAVKRQVKAIRLRLERFEKSFLDQAAQLATEVHALFLTADRLSKEE